MCGSSEFLCDCFLFRFLIVYTHTLFLLLYATGDFTFFPPHLHSRMYRMAIRYPLLFRHSRIAWTAASEELKVGSEQELSWTALLSSAKEAAADLRLVFNSFSSLDMLVSCERWQQLMWTGAGGVCAVQHKEWWGTNLRNGAYCVGLFNQLTVRLKEQKQLKVKLVESLTQFQLLDKKNGGRKP